MRKYIRNIIKCRAKQEKIKPSAHLKAMFDHIQRKKHGSNCRKANQAKGTHPKHLWSSRIAMNVSE